MEKLVRGRLTVCFRSRLEEFISGISFIIVAFAHWTKSSPLNRGFPTQSLLRRRLRCGGYRGVGLTGVAPLSSGSLFLNSPDRSLPKRSRVWRCRVATLFWTETNRPWRLLAGLRGSSGRTGFGALPRPLSCHSRPQVAGIWYWMMSVTRRFDGSLWVSRVSAGSGPRIHEPGSPASGPISVGLHPSPRRIGAVRR